MNIIEVSNIIELQKSVHENAVKKGFWNPSPSFGELIALCHSELSEALEEYRNGKQPNEIYYSCAEHRSANEGGECYLSCENCIAGKPEGIPIELADAVIRILDMCEHEGINLAEAIREKHEFNLTRPYKHGGKVI